MAESSEGPKLTPKQQRFCQEYIIDLNGTQAATRAGYSESNARQQASDILSLPYIADEIARLKAEVAKRLELEADDITRFYKSVLDGTVPIFDSVDLVHRNKAAEMLGKHIGYFDKDNHRQHGFDDKDWTIGIHEVVKDTADSDFDDEDED